MPPLSVASNTTNFNKNITMTTSLNSSNESTNLSCSSFDIHKNYQYITYILQLYLQNQLKYSFSYDTIYDLTKEEKLLAADILTSLTNATEIFKEKNYTVLKTMLAKCTVDGPHLSYNTFISVLSYLTEMSISESLSETSFTYGRLVGIISFLEVYSTYLFDNDCIEDIDTVILYSSKLIDKWIIMSWKRDNLSWEDFNIKTKLYVQKLNKEKESNVFVYKLTVVVATCSIVMAAIGIYYGLKKICK
uniref:Apoptosis regulator Bcl-2 homolog n=1 Tax=Parastrongyloides trichosuri TaxID=131310 RepID=A0A0N4ZNY7_PARTI